MINQLHFFMNTHNIFQILLPIFLHCLYCVAWNEKDEEDVCLLKHGYLNDRMEALFHLYLWGQSHITIAWNTRETGDIYFKYYNTLLQARFQLRMKHYFKFWLYFKSTHIPTTWLTKILKSRFFIKMPRLAVFCK